MGLAMLLLGACAEMPTGSSVEAGEVAVTDDEGGAAGSQDTAEAPAMSTASQSLLEQSRDQWRSGDSIQAAATLERALRIDPGQPGLWLELGNLRLAEGDYVQAEMLGRKALTLAGNNEVTRSASLRLMADALRGQGRNEEAIRIEADLPR